jgi:hypothetical protein
MGGWLLLAGFVRVILAQTGGAHQSRGIAEVLESPQLDPIFPPIPAVGQRHRIAHPLHRTSVPLKLRSASFWRANLQEMEVNLAKGFIKKDK